MFNHGAGHHLDAEFLQMFGGFFRLAISVKLGIILLPPSTKTIVVVRGIDLLKSLRKRDVAICASDAASSTPVCPPLTKTNVNCHDARLGRRLISAISYALRIFFCIFSASVGVLRHGANLRKFVMAEIARLHPCGDHKIV